MLGRQPVTVEIVLEACWHKYVPQLVLFPGNSHFFGIIVITMIPFVGGWAINKALSRINFFSPDRSPDGLELFLFILIYLFPESFYNMNYDHYLPLQR